MPIIPRFRRGTLLLAGAVWLAACAGLWWVLPVVPRIVIDARHNVLNCDFSPDMRSLITFSPSGKERETLNGSRFGELNIWDSFTGERIIGPIETWKSNALLLSSNDRRWIFLGPASRRDRRHRLFDTVNREIRTLPLAAPMFESHAAFCPNNRFLLIGADMADRPGVVLWDLNDWQNCGLLPGADFPVAVSNDGNQIAAVSAFGIETNTIYTYDPRTLKRQGTFQYPDRISSFDDLEFTPDGRFLLALVFDFHLSSNEPWRNMAARTVQSWDTRSGTTVRVANDVVGRFGIAPDSRSVIISRAYTAEKVEWRDIETGKMLRKLSDSEESSVSFPRDLSADLTTMAVHSARPDRGLADRIGRRFGLTWLIKNSGPRDWRCDLVATDTGLCVGHFLGYPSCWSRDGSAIAGLVDIAQPSIIAIWDVPPRPPLRWFAVGTMMIAMPIALLCWWRTRRSKAA
jgi:WD40 repeat protein